MTAAPDVEAASASLADRAYVAIRDQLIMLEIRPNEPIDDDALARSLGVGRTPVREALKRLDPLLGEWTLEAKPPDGPPWPGEARATIEWHDSGAHLVQRSTVEMPEAPDSISIMGCDAANGTYFQLYSDERGVCRVYEMSIGDGEWKLWREGEPFPQRFTATISDDGNTIAGRWEKAPDGRTWETDFDLTYRKVR